MSNMAKDLEHLKRHVEYPSDRAAIVAACNNMADVPSDDRAWFTANLPDGNYSAPEDVLIALLARV